MISKSLRFTLVPTLLVLTSVVSGIGCSGGDPAPAPAPAAGGAGGAATPKAPPEKGKGGRMIESEANTPKRLQGRDN